MTELEAVSAVKIGNKVAFKYLFDSYYNNLLAYIMTFTHDLFKSEDIVQQAFIILWKEREKLDDNKSPKGYLFAIAYNLYLKSLKITNREEKLLNQIKERALIDRINEESEISEKRIEKLKVIIDSLPPKCKEIIVMNKIQGIKYQDIAEEMGVSVKTIESQMRIAFKKIRESFKGDIPILFINFNPVKRIHLRMFLYQKSAEKK